MVKEIFGTFRDSSPARIWRSHSPLQFAWLLVVPLLLGGCFDPGEKGSFGVAQQGLYDANLSSDASALVAASINQGGSFWDLASKARRFNWNHHGEKPTVLVAVALAGDASYAVTVDQAPIMVLWDAKTGQALQSWMLPHEISSLALADAGRRLLIGTANNEALVFDLRRGGIEHRLSHAEEVNDVAISADGRLGLTVCDDDYARLWDLQQAKELHRWELDNNGMTAALSPSGRHAFAAGQSARAAVWDTRSGALLFELNPFQKWMGRGITYSSAVFSPREDELLTGSVTGHVKRWSLGSGQPLEHWILGRRSWITPSAVKLIALAYARNGDYLAVGSNGLVYVLGPGSG
ncbi:putative protein containing caspase domain protein [Thiorhodovibrio winogradskyi]|uniref:WD40 repeat domain-containing protein n=1 Tax=Thiorhodovibrio winogradskyi TaxID=77007 RepID=A0ABZ0SFS3_9GAMM|nr:hypothetical protein [Thiorhodovibrio winogradskyi]